MFIWRWIKKAFEDWAKRLQEYNAKEFGGKRTNCCALNRRKPHDIQQ